MIRYPRIEKRITRLYRGVIAFEHEYERLVVRPRERACVDEAANRFRTEGIDYRRREMVSSVGVTMMSCAASADR